MKKIAVTFLLTALLITTGAAALPAAAVEDTGITINVYNWGEYISTGDDGLMDVNEEFYNRTGIRVNYTTFDTNESLYTKLKSGGGNYDVIIPSDYMIGKMAAEGMLEELDPANIPNAALIGDAYRSKPFDPQNKYSVAYTWGLVCIVYNRTMVDEGDLEQGWGILWDEKYAGQVLMFNNRQAAGQFHQPRLRAGDRAGGRKAERAEIRGPELCDGRGVRQNGRRRGRAGAVLHRRRHDHDAG